jgi:hypothetical protein
VGVHRAHGCAPAAQALPAGGDKGPAITRAYASDAETPDSELTCTIEGPPPPGARVTLVSNQYVINVWPPRYVLPDLDDRIVTQLLKLRYFSVVMGHV